jgi:hypothetical protein
MRKIMFILVIILYGYGCNKDDNGITKFKIGTFHGEKTTYLYTPNESVDTITIKFDSTTYSYSTSNTLDFGRGKYFIKDNSIEFNDELVRNALYTYDWILSGMYNLQITDDSIILNQNKQGLQISCRLKKMTK